MSDQPEAPDGAVWADATAGEARQRYRTLLEAIEAGAVHLDDEGRIRAVNEGFLDITGYGRDALCGEHLTLVVDEADWQRLDQAISGVTEPEGTGRERVEVTITTSSDEQVACELRLQVADESRETVCTVRKTAEPATVDDVEDRPVLGRELGERSRSELLGNVPGMVYRCRNERGWPMAFVSDACEELTGYAPATVEEDEVSWGEDVIVQEDREMVWDTVQRETAEDGTFSITYRIETAEGERRWVRDYGRGLFDGEGELEAIEGIISDITARKETEQRLAEERDMFADGPAVVFRWEPDESAGWPVEYVSANVEDVLGYTPEELESGEVPYADLLLEEEIERVAREVEVATNSGTERFSHDPYRIETRDGDIRWVEDTTKIVRDDDGEVTSYLGYLVDITERKERQEELTQYESIIETVNDGVYVVDEAGRFTMVNEAYVEMVGYEREELLGEHVSLVVDDDVAQLAQRTETEMRRGISDDATVEAELRTAGGEKLAAEATFALLPTENGQDLRVGVARDISERKERERQLEESERLYRTLVEQFPNGAVALVDEDLRYRVAGGTPVDIEADSSDDLEGASVREAISDELADVLEPCFRAAHDGESSTFEHEHAGKHSRFHIFPVRDDDGEVFVAMGMSQDITERKRTERELQRSKEQLETLFDVLPVGVVVADADGGIRSANDAAHEIWGGDIFDAEAVEEYEKYPIFEPGTGEQVSPEEMTLARVVDGEEVTDPDVYEFHTVDDERRIVELEGMPIRDESGTVTRGVVTMSDVTERWEAQRNVEQSERRYRTLVENFPDGSVGLFDEELRYTVVGGQLFDELEFEPSDRIGQRITDHHDDELVAEIEPYFTAALDGERNTFEVEVFGRSLQATTLPIENPDGEVLAGMIVVQDVSERREFERKLKESNERLEQFAYAASHDLQEPLRMVSSYLQLIKERHDDEFGEETQEFLAFAVDGAERMREMIDGLLEYSRVETEGESFEPVDLDGVLDDVLENLQFKIEEYGAEISAESLPQVEGDRNQFTQVFQNVLDNAIEYSGDEPPRVSVSAERSGDQVTVSVSDKGIGIDPEQQDRVFEVFQRLHSRDEHAGTGIGLSLCRRIIERHGGEIWVESEPGKGTTVSFTLPAADTE